MEAVIRHLPGSLGNSDSVAEESFSEGLSGMVEYPHYTRPREYCGLAVPPILLSGDHAAIARWRRENSRPSPWAFQEGGIHTGADCECEKGRAG
jgi:tRNA (guanine37-N1)-methyltransferase